MQFDGTGTGALTATNLSHRYLWGPVVDQLLADEQVANGDLLVWTLGDGENTVRDLATYNSSTGVTTVVNHRVFSAYGGLLSQTNSSVGCLFAYTGQALDQATGLQNNLNRWYDAITGRWLSQDPSGFKGGDANLYRYCGNSPATRKDPSGEAWWNLWLADLAECIGDKIGTAINPPPPAGPPYPNVLFGVNAPDAAKVLQTAADTAARLTRTYGSSATATKVVQRWLANAIIAQDQNAIRFYQVLLNVLSQGMG